MENSLVLRGGGAEAKEAAAKAKEDESDLMEEAAARPPPPDVAAEEAAAVAAAAAEENESDLIQDLRSPALEPRGAAGLVNGDQIRVEQLDELLVEHPHLTTGWV